MRLLSLLPLPALLSASTALELPNFQPFIPALALPISLSDYIPPTPPQNPPADNPQHHDLLRRQDSTTCPSDFNSCESIGAPQVCCVSGASCAADANGHAACCPSGSACSGTIGGVITAGTVNSDGQLVGSATVSSAVAGGGQVVTSVGSSFVVTDSGLVTASTSTTIAPATAASSGDAFVIASGSTVATPGAGVRAEVPLIAKVIVRVLEMVPL